MGARFYADDIPYSFGNFGPFRGESPSDFSPLFGIPAKNVVKKGYIAPPFQQHFADFSPFCRKIIYTQNIEIIRYEMTFCRS